MVLEVELEIRLLLNSLQNLDGDILSQHAASSHCPYANGFVLP